MPELPTLAGRAVSGLGSSPAFEWMALRRVHDGGLVALDGRYFDGGRPVSGDVATALDDLIRDGCLALGRAGPAGRRTVCVTVAGQIRYRELRDGRGG